MPAATKGGTPTHPGASCLYLIGFKDGEPQFFLLETTEHLGSTLDDPWILDLAAETPLEEVDALLKGVSSGDVASGGGFGAPDAEVRELDLTNPNWQQRDRVPPLDFLNQVLARKLTNNLRPLLTYLRGCGQVVPVDERESAVV